MPVIDPIDVRPCTPADAAAVLRLVVEDEEQATGRTSRLGEPDIQAWWAYVDDLARDSWLLSSGGRPVGVGWFDRRDDVAIAVGVVAVSAKGQGVGGTLIDLAERRAAEAGAARVQQVTLAADDTASQLMAARGYAEVRRFFDMAIELSERPTPVVPDGLRLEPVREDEVRAFHAVLDEAFRDHWEHHPIPFEEWWRMRTADPDHDLSLWFVVRDGDELAGVVRNEPNRNGGGYVASIGVRRRWRGRGIARALLLQSFAAFFDRGVHRVTLGVDAQNPTGATQLYRSVGMAVELASVAFEKPLPVVAGQAQ